MMSNPEPIFTAIYIQASVHRLALGISVSEANIRESEQGFVVNKAKYRYVWSRSYIGLMIIDVRKIIALRHRAIMKLFPHGPDGSMFSFSPQPGCL